MRVADLGRGDEVVGLTFVGAKAILGEKCGLRDFGIRKERGNGEEEGEGEAFDEGKG